MRKAYFGLLFLLIYDFACAQSISSTVDSLTKSHLKMTDKNYNQYFNRLIAQREEKKLYARLDSINYDVVLVEAEMLEGIEDLCFAARAVEHIAEHHHQASSVGALGDVVQCLDHGGLLAALRDFGAEKGFQVAHDMPQVHRIASGGLGGPHLIVEDGEAHGIALFP